MPARVTISVFKSMMEVLPSGITQVHDMIPADSAIVNDDIYEDP